MTAATSTTSIPDTHRDCVLQAFLQGHTIPVLAEHYKLPIAAIVAFLNSPEIQTLRDDIALLAASQAELATAHARTSAILTLHAVINGQSIDPAQVRAASSLLRNTPKAPPRAIGSPHVSSPHVSSPHVSKGSASQPHDAAHAHADADTRPDSRPNARECSRASRQRHEPDPDSHPEPNLDRESEPAHTTPTTSRHARTEPDNADQASHESPADATAPDALHDHATPTTNARDRPIAAAA